MIPTSIDGTDITGATIDGTEVQEITVDGDTVFTAGPSLPVAYSNLIAWYPFDSAEYGGSNADDVTGILGGSGDDTAYDGTPNSITYDASAGVTDLNAGANSGAYEFFGVRPDSIDIGSISSQIVPPLTVTLWGQKTGSNNDYFMFDHRGTRLFIGEGHRGTNGFEAQVFDGSPQVVTSGINTQNKWFHFALTLSSSNTLEFYVDAVSQGSVSSSGISGGTAVTTIGSQSGDTGRNFLGYIDDVRFYNTVLSASQITNIYNNSDP